ncbi:MAG TPA: tryptophan 2,3-dioxygenase family protein [Saprospiraceae bacterium]|nr:tryptophan 2,3-dioxygenase family protein [Saprospiraceae bacterium]HMP14450.1 tryptophan 2,3-dioxygenase family protein [Saprospiraceae bacterium]
MQLTHDMLDRLDMLEQKYAVMGQDMLSYLDGLLYADYLTYWDYIHLDTLLSLQTPRTPFPDEFIFITYHQITELYFKLIIQALEQIIEADPCPAELFIRQIKRANRYFNNLVESFDMMVDGMDRDEFLKFRMSLLPASGFQSAQYRKIEILSTDMYNLVHADRRHELPAQSPIETLYPALYWKSGATELATGKKTLTLKQFEQKYASEFITLAQRMQNCNILKKFNLLSEEVQEQESIRNELKQYDFNINVRWALSHLRSAVRYLDNKPQVIAATGGTNWQQYLPPRYQRIIFFPDLWSDEDIENWGKRSKLS